MHRRSFLSGLGALTLTQGLMGCQTNNQLRLEMAFLRSTIPSQLFGEFRKKLTGGTSLDLDPLQSLAELFEQLQTWRRELNQASTDTVVPVRAVSIGHYWLSQAIQQELIQPLNLDTLVGWKQLGQAWQNLVTRDRQGQLAGAMRNLPVWGAPYRWGMTVIVYRKDKFAKAPNLKVPQDWDDLWQPELRGRVSLLDQPREVIGLALKRLGQSYNTPNPAAVAELRPTLAALNRQTKLYSSDTYLQPLILGDTWVAVGWSTDILPELSAGGDLVMVVPKSGTALWADLWVQPYRQQRLAEIEQGLFNQWLDFWWQPEIVNQLSQFSNAPSPLTVKDKTPGRSTQLLLPPTVDFARHEFIEPLGKQATAQYRQLWVEMRRVEMRRAEMRGG
jgi:putative spermidine/putrescine transport system substrate-binding protein